MTMRPNSLQTKIFLDSGDPHETQQAIELLGFLDGQTTNPTLVAKNPELISRFNRGDKLSHADIQKFYLEVIQMISQLIPVGSISIEVFADSTTTADVMVSQANEMNTWIPNAHIKLPITKEGLKAAQILVAKGIRVNMTLCFSQEQGAAVYSATRGAKKGDVFLSPFIGRLDDQGENGMSLIHNIQKLFTVGDGHVEVLAASVRTYEHFLGCVAHGVDIVTAPLAVLREWKNHDLEIPSEQWKYNTDGLIDIPYIDMGLDKELQEYDVYHKLTDVGIDKFVSDWNNLIST